MRCERTKKKVAGAVAVAFLVLLLAAGCDSTPKSHPAGPTLAPSDLGLPAGASAASEFAILESRGTAGRFPLALAVARLGAGRDDAVNRGWQIASLKEEQAVWWNSLFNNVPAVREVVIMSAKTAGPPGAGMPALINKARRLNARLCLVFGPAPAGPDEAALIGALFDTQTGQAIARIQAQATPADFQPHRRPDGLQGDRRHVDPQYFADRRFQEQVRDCVLELIKRDALPTAASAPNPEK